MSQETPKTDEPGKKPKELGGVMFDPEFFVSLNNSGSPSSLRESIQKMNPDDRRVTLDLINRILAKDPNSIRTHLEWQRCAMLLSMFDAKAYAGIEKKINANVTSLVALTDQIEESDIDAIAKEHLPKADQPLQRRFEAQTARFNVLYRLVGMDLPERARLFVDLAFNRMDQDMNRRLGPEYERFLRMQTQLVAAAEKKMLKDATPDLKKLLDGLPKEAQAAPRIQQRDGEYFFESHGEQSAVYRWKLQMYPSGLAGGMIMFRSADPKKPGLVFVVDEVRVIRAMIKDVAILDGYAGSMMRDYEKEHGEEQAKALNSYDVPADRTVTHINVFPRTHDTLVERTITTSTMLSAALADRYKGRFTRHPPLFTENPNDDLRRAIRAAVAGNRGKPVHFCIDVFSHGSEEQFGFLDGFDARAVAEIVREFPECSFTLNTIACHGAGMTSNEWLQKELQKDPDLRRRLAIFTQVRPEDPNLNFGYAGTATNYYSHFILAIREGKTYGEAHRIADLAVKEHSFMDAQAIIDGKLRVRRDDYPEQRPAA